MTSRTEKQKIGRAGSVLRHRIQSGGKRTSLSLEGAFWDAFNEIATSLRIPPGDLLARAIAGEAAANHSSAVRLFGPAHYRHVAAGKNDVIG